MQTISTLTAAGNTDPGLQREVNEDRFHVDLSRGIFILVILHWFLVFVLIVTRYTY